MGVGEMEKLCRPFACAITANDMEEIELVAVIDRMRSSVVVEKGAGDDAAKAEDALSLAAFQAALKEEQEAEQAAAAAAQLDEGAEKEDLPKRKSSRGFETRTIP